MVESASSCAALEPDSRVDRTERQLRTLQELAEIGMDLARDVRRQALEPTADEAARSADLGLIFSRIARAVRQTLALEARLAEDRGKLAERPALGVSDRWRSARRKRQVKGIVGDVIDAEADSDFEARRLYRERDERLEDGDEEADFADLPIGELVARICRDLDVDVDWSLFEDEDWAIEEARARPPGSPFALGGPRAVEAGSDDPPDRPPDELSPKPPWRTH
jgi:hypothetical protein